MQRADIEVLRKGVRDEGMSRKTVLVTGASGFLGREVISQLVRENKYDLAAAVSGRRDIHFPAEVRVYPADLLEAGACEKLVEEVKPQALLHLAWCSERGDDKAAEGDIQWLAVSTRLLRAFAGQGGECFLFAGPCLENDDDVWQTERRQMDIYGACKRSFAEVMRDYCSNIGMRFIDARLCPLYGRGDPHGDREIPQVISDLLKDSPVSVNDPFAVVDLLHVEDAARALVMAMESEYCGPVDVGSGRPVVMKDILCRIAGVLGKEKLLSFSEGYRPRQMPMADTSALQEKIGCCPSHSFAEDLAETVEWWKGQRLPVKDVGRERRVDHAAACPARKRIMVTGASGLIGHAVVEQLSRRSEYEVIAVTSGRNQMRFPDGVRVEGADLLDEDARVKLMERVQPDMMIHYAWGLENNRFLGSEGNIRWLEVSLRLLELFCSNGGKRFLFAGAASEYGDGGIGYVETPSEQTYTIYGVCKLAMDRVGTVFCRDHGVEFITARYSSVYGPEDDRPGRALPLAIQTLLRGETFVCGKPWNIWDYIYIDDAVEATVRLMESGYCGPMNIASGRPTLMKDIFQMAADIIGCPERMQCDESATGGKVFVVNISNMRSVLHYTCPTLLRDGLEKTVAWWRLQKKKQ